MHRREVVKRLCYWGATAVVFRPTSRSERDPYPVRPWERGVVNSQYPYDDARRFGVTGAGGDETQALQNAVASVGAGGGGVCRIPAGTVHYSTVMVPESTVLAGAGSGVTVLQRLALPAGPPGLRLFGVRLSGPYSGVRDLTCRGLWQRDHPHDLTYDVNVAVCGNGVHNVSVERVESSDAHIGFLLGGLVGTEVVYTGQDNANFVACHAHDTADVGFAFSGRDMSSGANVGTRVSDCDQERSAFSAGFEFRHQRNSVVASIRAKTNADAKLGAGVRFEETQGISASDITTEGGAFGMQLVNDTQGCTIDHLQVNGAGVGVLIRSCADVAITQLSIADTASDAIVLGFDPDPQWKHNNERVALRNGKIFRPGREATAAGVRVVSSGFNDPRAGLNGSELQISGLSIVGASGAALSMGSANRFTISDCLLVDNQGNNPRKAPITLSAPAALGSSAPSPTATGVLRNVRYSDTHRTLVEGPAGVVSKLNIVCASKIPGTQRP